MLGTLRMTVDEAIDAYRSNFMFERTKEPKKPRMERASRLFGKLRSSSKAEAAETATGTGTGEAPLFDQDAFRKQLARIALRAGQKSNARGASTTSKTVITATRT